MVVKRLYCRSGKYSDLEIAGKTQPTTVRCNGDADAATCLLQKKVSGLQKLALMKEQIAVAVSTSTTTLNGAHTCGSGLW